MPEKLFALSQKPKYLLLQWETRARFARALCSWVRGWRYFTALLSKVSYLQHIQPSTASISKKGLHKQFHDIVDPRWRKGYQLHQNTRLRGSLGM